MRLVLLSVFALSLAGCRVDQQIADDVETLKAANTALRAETLKLTFRIAAAEEELTLLRQRADEQSLATRLLETEPHRSARLTLTDKAYDIAKTPQGALLVSVEDAKPYANGVKVLLQIGNPNNITYTGLDLGLTWGKTDSKNPTAPTTKNVSLPATLTPGAWNTVEVVLAPAKIEEVEYLRVSVGVNNVSLRKAK